MVRRLELRLAPSADPAPPAGLERIQKAAAKALGQAPEALGPLRVRRVSFDARPRHRQWLVEVEIYGRGESLPSDCPRVPPEIAAPAPDAPHVAVVGAGPAGMFAALRLLQAGLRVSLFERGGDVRQRRRPLALLNRGQRVDPDSNYCFGEGGAGTYSDGKLYARSASREDKQRVLETLVAHGAPAEILCSWRPHVGSNRLPKVVEALRNTLLRAEAKVHFHTRVEDLLVEAQPNGGRRVRGLWVRDLGAPASAPRPVAADAVVFATGHSARDSLEVLLRAGVRLTPKGFALGVRVEHPQALVDEHQYGGLRRTCDLPAAFYEWVEQVDGRGVYSFCMCPGGWIVPATTAPDRVVVNGMSLSRRDSPYANSGLVVQLEPGDWCGQAARSNGWAEWLGGAPAAVDEDPMFGVRVQEEIERRAALWGGGAGRSPSQGLARFVSGATGQGSALPTSYRPGVTPVDLGRLLPPAVASRLLEGLRAFDRRLPGFAGADGQMLAPETRTSSPVRVPRDPSTLEAEAWEGGALEGLYPAGEGAGYAGGIVSAALDGERVAAKVAQRLRS